MPSSIPAPTDSYDHETSFAANVTSIKALLAAFDAQMDSLNESIDHEMERLDQLGTKCDRIENKIETLRKESEGCKIKISCPATYSQANHQELHQESPFTKSARASDEAVRSILKEDALRSLNAPPARLSDEWLDQAKGFDEEIVCRQALKMNIVPPLRILNSVKEMKTSDGIYAEELKYYRSAFMKEEALRKEETTRMRHDDISILSEGMGTMYTNYSTMSTGPAASRRRRRKMAVTAMKAMAEGNSDPHDGDESLNFNARQNFMNGGLAYACEAVHDLFGTNES